ncbi:hypothetical protein PC9H_009194 [Pleurotus ostreatus]|uniref:Uncharacterized protein n=1 Tax=Pleurotus ostreatus TaxID=5322 RepID=A0A8H7DR08_PLEOS|nr:uncharacterized protein PC9H_009194 [Pleurotus ostreatus]KAF7426825.1 hypothetical protein PC9H_009194 [Pleurotus ostreatus]
MVQHQPPSTLTANHCAATMHANEVLGATAGILQYEEVHAPLSIKNPSILTTALTLSQRKLSRQTPRDSRQRENGRGQLIRPTRTTSTATTSPDGDDFSCGDSNKDYTHTSAANGRRLEDKPLALIPASHGTSRNFIP